VDTIDVAQQRQQEEIDHALQARRAVAKGPEFCSVAYCGEPISALRRDMGAKLCIDCANAREREAQRWAPRAHG
jgi:RNA polymerase-binding transcription factor DksA